MTGGSDGARCHIRPSRIQEQVYANLPQTRCTDGLMPISTTRVARWFTALMADILPSSARIAMGCGAEHGPSSSSPALARPSKASSVRAVTASALPIPHPVGTASGA
jgi:hypothetical protein